MHILNTNFYTLCNSFISNNLNQLNIEFNQDSAICVYVNPKVIVKNGSNSKYDLYFENNCENIYYSNIEINKDHKYSLSSRCLALIETDANLYNCYRKVYNRLNDIHGNIYYRKDIGSNFLSKYEKYGVSIQNANKSLKEIKSNILSYNENIISDFGSFGGELKINLPENSNLHIFSVDGVGTKTDFVRKYKGEQGLNSLGKDIVNHCINDILVQGAIPIFLIILVRMFNLKIEQLKYFIEGVSQACNSFEDKFIIIYWRRNR